MGLYFTRPAPILIQQPWYGTRNAHWFCLVDGCHMICLVWWVALGGRTTYVAAYPSPTESLHWLSHGYVTNMSELKMEWAIWFLLYPCHITNQYITYIIPYVLIFERLHHAFFFGNKQFGFILIYIMVLFSHIWFSNLIVSLGYIYFGYVLYVFFKFGYIYFYLYS